MQSTTITDYQSRIAATVNDFLKKAGTFATGGNYAVAKTLWQNAGDLLEILEGQTGSVKRPGRPRKPSAEDGIAAPMEAQPGTKVAMQDLPRLIAERFPNGATYEQIRTLAGWKETAPSSNIHRLLVKPGKLTLDAQGIFRAPPALFQQTAVA